MIGTLSFLSVFFLYGNSQFPLVHGATAGPARTSCDAAFNAPCSRVNSEWLATDTAQHLAAALQKQNEKDATALFREITNQMYNMEKGFYPFVFDRSSSICVAHGSNPSLVGESLESIFSTMGIGFSSSQALKERFVQAASRQGDWVQYMWRDHEEAAIVSKVAFVTNATDRYYVGVGYDHKQLPPDLPCSDKFDSWCSINNVRSLVGKAQLRLNEAETLEQFEAALYDISFDQEEYQIPGGHYLFMYNYKGALKAHAHLHRFAGHPLPYMFENLNRDPEEGAALHQLLMAAAEGKDDGWAQYKWKNKVDEPEYTKIAYNVKIEFMGEEYYLGCGYNFIMGDVVSANMESDVTCSSHYNLPCAFGTTLQLSSHALSHSVSSPLEVGDMLEAIEQDPSLQSGDYYVFVFDFNSTCVAHGAAPSFKGLTAAQIYQETDGASASPGGISLHEQFRTAAEQGGGYVFYETEESHTQKIAYIFKFTIEGRNYYGGVGFDYKRAPVQIGIETGAKKNGESIPCSQQYGSACSEINSQAIVGQALADLIVASTETKVSVSSASTKSVEDVLSDITGGSDAYRVNDFYVAVFSLDQSLCSPDEEVVTGITAQDSSGCCIAHGGNSTFVGKSWQDILDLQKITSIRGQDLHSRLTGQTDRGGHWTEYSWAERDGGAKTRMAFSSRFKHETENYYIVVEYFKDLPPPTCDACPRDMECTRDDQAFCEIKVEETKFTKSTGFIALLLVVVGVPLMGILFCWIGKRREKRQAEAQIREIGEKMQTMSKQIEDEKKTTAKTQKLVSSLFPKTIQDRILEELDDGSIDREVGRTTNTDKMTSFLKNDGTSSTAKGGVVAKSRPIADLFPSATICFADIAGFTAWSSTRNPSQVFSLLETLYQCFDRLASNLSVFKVETVGDCYVAVAGLPEKRPDHAIVMAQFSWECLNSFNMLVKQLEIELGPDTAELGLRVGIHSGPVTAGVLRGDRGRFQLFGDTVNTAARMESNGKTNRIQLSQETADLLTTAGYRHWIEARTDRIVAKGKGTLQTYWLVTTAPDLSGISRNKSTRTLQPVEAPGDRHQRLVDWNVDILKKVLVEVIARRRARGTKPDTAEHLQQLEEEVHNQRTTLKEVKEIVSLPRFDPDAAQHTKEVSLDDRVQHQLQKYVTALSSMYRDNPFHSFEHASHVTMSVVKLLGRIVAPELKEASSNSLHDHTYGITSDPLTQFAVLLSALIHDVDHPGVPNSQLVKEQNFLAAAYENQSVAELNSLDLSWSMLMLDDFTDLRQHIYSTEAEFKHFRSLMVNIVLATDIQDAELKNLRNARWNKAFSDEVVVDESPDISVNRKATIVMEHLIQASDVAHTMQHWHVYQKWNERFFMECYHAYKDGRSDKDPSENWYEGEKGFFDFYIIPLAKKLKDCGVFGVSSDEYLQYAQTNRREWELKGKTIVATLVEKARTVGRPHLKK